MSHKATNWAVSQRGLKPIAKVILWHLADRHHPDNGCFPSQAALAADCEISRASVNRYLDELEAAGLIRREQRVDPISKKQLPTRYVLAFEDDFGTPDVVARVSTVDTAPCLNSDDSRVSNSANPVSQSCETLTSNRTSKGTGNGRARVSFEVIWNSYPRRPMTNRVESEAEYERLSDDETHRCEIAARRYAQWHIEDADSRKEAPEAALEYRIGLPKWLRTGLWGEALTVPLKSDPAPPEPNGLVTLTPDHPDYQAVERMLGKKLLAFSGKRTFRIEEIQQAKSAEHMDMGQRGVA